VTGAGGQALCVPADLADPASPHRIVDACLARYGRLDGLVSNAAMVRHMPVGEWDTGGFDEHVATNIRAPFFRSRRRCRRCANHPSVRWSMSPRPRGRCAGPASRFTG
jgi:NAD(P)-dependent dehydrogenase (short-subunit alcohol dehydrogenase family)